MIEEDSRQSKEFDYIILYNMLCKWRHILFKYYSFHICNMSQYMFHMCSADTWTSLKQSSTPYYPPTYEADGFIHLTADPSLLLQVGNHFYKGDPGKWTLLVIDSSKLTSEVGSPSLLTDSTNSIFLFPT